MNRSIFRRAFAVAVIPAALVLAACGSSGSQGTRPSMDHGSMTSSAMGHSTADVEFAQMMIPHHQQAVQMAALAATRASDPELAEIAAAIKAAQSPEITTMTGWLTAWGQPTEHAMPGMSMSGMASDAEMQQLAAATGVDFDRMLARMMIAHHNGAIQMCGEVLTSGSDPQVKVLATTMRQGQSAEVGKLQAILDRL